MRAHHLTRLGRVRATVLGVLLAVAPASAASAVTWDVVGTLIMRAQIGRQPVRQRLPFAVRVRLEDDGGFHVSRLESVCGGSGRQISGRVEGRGVSLAERVLGRAIAAVIHARWLARFTARRVS
jgi:hypothetical protein